MHIPDGFLSPPVWAGLNALSLPAVALAARRAQAEAEETRIPMLGVMGAFVFAAQMINFPVGVGTSGHLVGGALLAITLGPAAACVVMTAILVIQALIFQDGGILALGANVFNMAVTGVLAGYVPYALWGRGRLRNFAIALGGVMSVFAGAGLAIAQLLLSGTTIPTSVLNISAGIFFVTGLLEGAITLAVIRGAEALNPNFVRKPLPGRNRAVITVLVAAVALAGVGFLFASQNPDGLESLAERAGFASKEAVLLPAPMADYELSLFSSSVLRKASAGLLGLGLMYGIALCVGQIISRRRA